MKLRGLFTGLLALLLSLPAAGQIINPGVFNITATGSNGVTVSPSPCLPGSICDISLTPLATMKFLANTTGGSAVPIATALPLDVTLGGTGATTAAGARTNLGLGTMAVQNANAVAITGGAIDGTTVGSTTKAAGAFTTLLANTSATLPAGATYIGDTTAPTNLTPLGIVIGTDTSTGQPLIVRKSVTGTAGATTELIKSRGTQAVPIIIVTGDTLGQINGRGYDGTGYTTAGTIVFGSEGTIALNQVPGNILLRTASSTGTLTTALTIDSAQTLLAASSVTAARFVPNNSTVATNGLYLPGANTPSISANSLRVADFTSIASAVNRITFSNHSTGNAPFILVAGSDTNVGFDVVTQAAGAFSVRTNGGALQFQVTHTASATRYLTATGSNGGSPALDTSAGPLSIGGTTATGVQLGGSTALTLTAGSVGMPKITASASAPGASGGKLELVCGTNAGSAKLIIAAGTSATAVTIIDNVGSGVSGC